MAADMSGLPVAAATLEAMPRDAQGVAFFEITKPQDRQPINAPSGIEIHRIVHLDPHAPLTQSVDVVRSLSEFTGSVQTCITVESGMVRSLRKEILNRRGVPKADAYISGYWKIGHIEPEHQQFKNALSA